MTSRKSFAAFVLEKTSNCGICVFLCPLEVGMNDIRGPVRVNKVRRLDLSVTITKIEYGSGANIKNLEQDHYSSFLPTHNGLAF